MTQSTVLAPMFLEPYETDLPDGAGVIYTYDWSGVPDWEAPLFPNECVALFSSWLGAP